MTIRAAAERVCLTPDYRPFYLTGYNSPLRKLPAQGVHDDIYAQISLIDVNGIYFYLFSTDWISVEEGFYEEVSTKLNQKYGIDKNHVFITATHNHQSVGDQMRKDPHFNQEYYDKIVSIAADNYEKCLKKLEETQVFFGKRTVVGYYGSRVLKDSLADNDIYLLEFRNDKDEVVTAICNWATHSTAITPENALLTGEFAQNTCKEYQKLKGYYPHMIVGAAGDSSTRPTRQGNDFNELERISKGVAAEMAKIEVDQKLNLEYRGMKTITHDVYAKVDHDDVQKKIDDSLKELETATDFDRIKVLKSMQPALRKLQEKDEVEAHWFAHAIDLNDLEIIVTPAELASPFGFEIKDASQAKCCLIFGYCNGKAGYLFPEDLYGLTFETISSGIPPKEVRTYIDKILSIV